jgi:hypothetical protein
MLILLKKRKNLLLEFIKIAIVFSNLDFNHAFYRSFCDFSILAEILFRNETEHFSKKIKYISKKIY